VERSGQGADRMFEVSIKESKPRPDFAGTDAFQVSIALYGEVQDLRFLKFLEQIGQETLASFTTKDLLILDYVHRDKSIPEEFKDRLAFLRDRGVIEVSGRGRGTRYILSRRLYAFIGKKGTYTRKRGLDRETNKALLLRHLDDYEKDGSRLQDLAQVLPHLTHSQVQKLLAELKKQGKIRCSGKTNAARWFPAG
jgi:ATP-dependent DNA helicase RecG